MLFRSGEIIDLGVKFEIIEKSGAWFSYGDERIGQGRENAKKFLIENIDIAQEIEDKIRVANGLNNNSVTNLIEDNSTIEND